MIQQLKGGNRWLAEFEQVPIKPEVRRKIMVDNARQVLGLTE